MNVLLLAPHPFYQDRGTPIAISLLLKVYSNRAINVDVITYHEGRDLTYVHVTVHRIPRIPFIRGIRPGFSWKKVICDVVMAIKALLLVSRKSNQYQLVHAVEESVYIAVLLKWLFRIPYVYDMDSSLAEQMVGKYQWLMPIQAVLNQYERLVVTNAKAVVPVCKALSKVIEKYNPNKIVLLHDVALLQGKEGLDGEGLDKDDLKLQLGVAGLLIMYVGNLEEYQGIDLLLESFALVLKKTDQADLVIIGGQVNDIEKYRNQSESLGMHGKVHYLGPKPVQDLFGYLSQADILVSPRIKGNNTPMKVYSYLYSGKPVLATDLPTHTQILNDDVAMLAKPFAEAFARAMLLLIANRDLRSHLGRAGRKLVCEEYSYEQFRERLTSLLDWLEKELALGYQVGGAFSEQVPRTEFRKDEKSALK